MDLTNELLEKARGAQNAEELLTLAKESGIELTREEAEAKLALLHPADGELADSELDNIAGGCGGSGSKTPEPKYHGGQKVAFEHLAFPGKTLEGRIRACEYRPYSFAGNTGTKSEWVYTINDVYFLYKTINSQHFNFDVREQDIKYELTR